jgi:hypothetical protein
MEVDEDLEVASDDGSDDGSDDCTVLYDLDGPSPSVVVPRVVGPEEDALGCSIGGIRRSQLLNPHLLGQQQMEQQEGEQQPRRRGRTPAPATAAVDGSTVTSDPQAPAPAQPGYSCGDEPGSWRSGRSLEAARASIRQLGLQLRELEPMPRREVMAELEAMLEELRRDDSGGGGGGAEHWVATSSWEAAAGMGAACGARRRRPSPISVEAKAATTSREPSTVVVAPQPMAEESTGADYIGEVQRGSGSDGDTEGGHGSGSDGDSDGEPNLLDSLAAGTAVGGACAVRCAHCGRDLPPQRYYVHLRGCRPSGRGGRVTGAEVDAEMARPARGARARVCAITSTRLLSAYTGELAEAGAERCLVCLCARRLRGAGAALVAGAIPSPGGRASEPGRAARTRRRRRRGGGVGWCWCGRRTKGCRWSARERHQRGGGSHAERGLLLLCARRGQGAGAQLPRGGHGAALRDGAHVPLVAAALARGGSLAVRQRYAARHAGAAH